MSLQINMMIDEKGRYFKTSNFYISAFLFTKGLELVNVVKLDSRHSSFVFRDTPERENFVQSFNFAKENCSEVMVDARKFVVAIKTLKDKLYQNH